MHLVAAPLHLTFNFYVVLLCVSEAAWNVTQSESIETSNCSCGVLWTAMVAVADVSE